MKLSERIAVLQAALAKYGDTEVLRFDMEEGYDETFTEPEVCKLIDGGVVSQLDYEMRLKSNERRQECVDSIDEAWASLDDTLRSSWGSKDVFIERVMQGIRANDRILEAWPTAPIVLVI